MDKAKPVTMTDNTDQISNQPRHLKRSAQEALKAAKILEARKLANGYRYEKGPDRSWRLVGASLLTDKRDAERQ
jgi:hypothetical protein